MITISVPTLQFSPGASLTLRCPLGEAAFVAFSQTWLDSVRALGAKSGEETVLWARREGIPWAAFEDAAEFAANYCEDNAPDVPAHLLRVECALEWVGLADESAVQFLEGFKSEVRIPERPED